MAGTSFRWAPGLAFLALLIGCGASQDARHTPEHMASQGGFGAVAPQSLGLRAAGEEQDLLTALALRPAAIEPGTPYAAVASAVLRGGAFRTDAELRLAPLRGEAEELAWLPALSRDASLSELRDISARIMARPERFDTPRKLAERDLAQAQIEAAALALAQEANAYVRAALALYLRAEEARLHAALYEETYRSLAGLDWPMSRAVSSGELRPSDLEHLQAVVARVRQALAEARAEEAAAGQELTAMTDVPLDGVKGIAPLRELVGATALPVLQAKVERDVLLARQQLGAHAHLEGLQLRRSAEELAALEEASGFDGEGDEGGAWSVAAPRGLRPERTVDGQAELQIGTLARDREALRTEAAQAAARAAVSRQVALRALRESHAGPRHAAQALGPLEMALEAQEAEIASGFALARSELDLAYLRGTLVGGDAL